MIEYDVNITDEALEDMESIYQYIAYDLLSPETALGQYERIAAKVLKLEILANRYQIIDSEPWLSLGLRRLSVDNFSIFYVIRESSVYVTDVLYNGADIDSRLKVFIKFNK